MAAGGAASASTDIPADADPKAAAFFEAFYGAYGRNAYNDMAAFYAEDAVFEDPTSDAFVRGKAKLRAAMNSLDPFRKLHWRFHQIVRQGNIYAGQATVTGEAAGVAFMTRFATMVEVADGKIVRHIDYVDNRPIAAAMGGEASTALWDGRAPDAVASDPAGKAKKGEATRLAREYIAALDRVDADAAGRLYAPDAVFEDPTFRLFLSGRDAIGGYAKAAFPNYEYVRFMPETIIGDAQGAVIEGTGFGVADGFQAPMRFMTFLRVADGWITSHTDFFDYGEYERLSRARDLVRDTQAVTDACADAAFQKLAFWVGDWTAKTPGGTTAGKNRIERVAGGCAILEHWDGLYLVDMKRHFARGLHWYDPAAGGWRHVWIDDAGKPLEMIVRDKTGPGVVYRPAKEPDSKKRTRMTIRPREDGGVEQFGEESTDSGRTWKETFRLIYSRAR